MAIISKVTREKSGTTTTTSKGGVVKTIINVGEIHMVLKNKSGEIKEDRLTIDKQRRK